jgi:hypothetical protein
MDQAALVEMQVRDGQRLVERLAREGVAVTAAAWVKETESGQWYLYLATPLVSEDGAKRAAYRRVNAVIREMQPEGFELDPFVIKVIRPHDPTATDILAHGGSRAGRTATWFQGSRLGALAVEAAYIYPPMTNSEAAGGLNQR